MVHPVLALQQHQVDRPRRLAFTFAGERLDYGDLAAEATRLARRLVARGVAPGERVTLVLPAGLDLVRTFVAVQLAGAAPCALHPGLPASVTVQRALRTWPSLVVVPSSRLAELGAAAGEAGMRLATLESLEGTAGGVRLPAIGAPADVSHLQLTSGTDGEPRAAVLTVGGTAAYLDTAREALELDETDRFVTWAPPWHDLGLYHGLLYPLSVGCEAHLVEPSIATLDLWLRTLSRVGGTLSGAPDFAYRIATRSVDPAGIDLARLRLATDGGEPVRRQTIEDFERRFGAPGRLRPAYGSAEANLAATMVRRGAPLREDAAGTVSTGTPFPGAQVRIVGGDGADARRGEIGEVVVRTPGLFAGYLDAPADTAAVLRDGWFHSGDAGLLDERGELYVVGRQRNLLKRAGATLAPREVEQLADAVPGMRLCAAVMVGDRIVVAVETRAGASAPEVAARVSAAVRQGLSFAPDVLVLGSRTIPRTENGKVRHRALKALLESARLPPEATLHQRGGDG